ncbi:MAG: serine/threonine-protein phosphatase [Pseudomonadales bacterium]|nr:serine/threonine-protein phosphatase [Pseudomonadales bacterium]MCP5186033.1 serine/threonine-protein phosphatase [Pseudomonadales bacterium]
MSEAQHLHRSVREFVTACRSHRGNVRKLNEDAVLANGDADLWVVADGMGGHMAGDHASRAIVTALSDLRFTDAVTLADRLDELEDILIGIHDTLQRYGREQFGGATVGSTVAAMLVHEGHALAVWAGDSRLYRLRDGRLEQVTRDHNPVSDLLDVGEVTEAEALTADTNVITRAVGGHGPLHLDLVLLDVQSGDDYLLCTDGLYRELSHNELESILGARAGDDVERVADRLLDRCLQGVAQDNVSLIVTHVREG